jgi:hypothetical protein
VSWISFKLGRTSVMAMASLALLALMSLGGCGASLGTNGAPSAQVATDILPAQQSGSVAVAQNAQPGIGGTGKQNGKTPGIGGTGQLAGTPGIGGTGIIGTVSGFGSILVNGFEVEYAPDLPVTFKDRAVRPDALRIGQVVEVLAVGTGKHLRARRIAVRHEVAGPIQRIDHARRMAVVFGQRIEIPSGVISTANGTRVVPIRNLAVGDHIDVSGLRLANGVIAASRIDMTGTDASAVLRGRVTTSDQTGFVVNGVRIDAPLASRPRNLRSGQNVQIVGTAIRGRLRARRINPAPARPFAGRVKRLSVEGYVTRAISGGVAVGGVPITQLPARARIQAGDRVILDGPVGARGRFAPSRVRAPVVRLRFQSAPSRNPNGIQPAPRRQVLPPAAPPPVIRRAPQPRPPVYRPPPRRSGR